MAQRDLIVSFLSAVPTSVVAMYYSRPLQLVCPVTQFGGGGYPGGRAGYSQWLSQFGATSGPLVPGMWKAAGGQPGDSIGRVCVMGFSNGCIGVDEILRASDSNRIDTVLVIDGMHGSYGYEGKSKVLKPAFYKNYLNHAAHVVNQDPELAESQVMVVSHSAIVPPDFPSTTETANLLWDAAWSVAPEDVLTLDCDVDCAPVRHERALAEVVFAGGRKVCPPNGKCFSWSGLADGWLDRRIANNLFVLGWGDRSEGKVRTRDPMGLADHIFQGQVVLNELLKQFTVNRWNGKCGLVATAGLGQGEPTAVCEPGGGLAYDQAQGGKQDWFPNLPSQAPVQPTCPAPPAGHIIVGGNGPCTTAPEPKPAPQVVERLGPFEITSWQALAAALGLVGGWSAAVYGKRALFGGRR